MSRPKLLFTVHRHRTSTSPNTLYTMDFYSDGSIKSSLVSAWSVVDGKVVYLADVKGKYLGDAGIDVQEAYRAYVARLVLE